MENSEEKKPDSKQKKIFEMFTRVTPKTKSVVPSNPESTIDLTSRSPPSSGSSSRHGKNVFTKMIDIKKVNGKEPLLLEALESMLEKSDEDEPKKKTRPGPKFSKERSRKSHHKKSNESLQAEGESPANNTKSSELSAQSQDIMDSSQSSHQGDDQNLLMPLDNVRQRKRRLSPGSPVAPRNTRHNSKNESEKQNEISVKIEKNQDVPENTQMEEIESAKIPNVPEAFKQPARVSPLVKKPHELNKADKLNFKKRIVDFLRKTSYFKCMSVDCLYVTLNSGEMKQHVINHLGSKGSLQCAFCPKGATDADDLIDHLLETHKEDMYQCQCCFYNNEDWKTIADHRKTHSKEDAEKPFFVIKKC